MKDLMSPPAVMVFIWLVFIVENDLSFLSLEAREYGLSETVPLKLYTFRKRICRCCQSREPPHSTMIVAGSWFLLNGLHLQPFLFRRHRRRYSHIDLSRILCMRYDLYTLLLPVPGMDDEKQMLRQLPYIRLGLCHDVNSSAASPKLPHAQSLPFSSIALLINWEIYFRLHPETFFR